MSILEWENLNKKARRLQSQLFNKLSTYEQIDGGDDVDHEIQGYEIERLLSQLDAVANTMTVTCDGTTPEWNQRMRIVREAHNSFSSDFYRQKKNLTSDTCTSGAVWTAVTSRPARWWEWAAAPPFGCRSTHA